MRNPIFRSKISNSDAQRLKNKKNETSFSELLTVLLITRSQVFRFGRNLVEMDPRSLPQLSKQLRDQNNSEKQEKTPEPQNFWEVPPTSQKLGGSEKHRPPKHRPLKRAIDLGRSACVEFEAEVEN